MDTSHDRTLNATALNNNVVASNISNNTLLNNGMNTTAVSALEVFSPEKIIKTLQEKEDCSDDLVEIIRTTQSLQLKKLANIFLKVQNFEIERIIELTVSKTRLHRFNSTFLVLSLIKSSYLSSKMLDKIEILFQSVFISRFRDIDPSIRAMCVQFLSEWICASNALRNMDYLKYIGWSLNDRNDSVRRKAVKSFLKISKFCKPKANFSDAVNPVERFVEKYKSRLVEVALQDCNPNIQKECCRAILSIFLKNEQVFATEEILAIISNDDSCNDLKFLALKKLCPEGIWELDSLHNILKQTKSHVFKNLKLSDSDVESFILNICEFIRNRSACCDNNHVCFLDILTAMSFNTDPIIFLDLFEVVKDNSNNIRLVVQALCSVSSFANFPGSTFKILEYLRKMAENNDSFIDKFAELLKKLEDIYSLQVETIISELKTKYVFPLIKFFDISSSVDQSSSPIVKCYATLWKILQEDYEWVKNLEFGNKQDGASIIDTDIFENSTHGSCAVDNFLELVDFVVFFHSKLPEEPYSATEPTDPVSCSKILFDKLISYISANFHFNDQESCIRLFKLISIGQFAQYSKRLFDHCSEELLLTFTDNLKDIKPLVCGYFEYLEDRNSKKYPEVSRKLAAKINRNEKDRYFFNPIRKLVSRIDLLDNILINFVPCLSVNECIVLENLAPKSKFKTQALRKCRSSKGTEENITFI
ncbi:uncharacterized protein VICG_01729 [Vittaforma corneae ATCC 50505]|uniref:SCD domain-containing protein n=1 Tax=Vittaforma corneae (strain ATCC 50505) TaxID=993615 RepID=L2GL62_VITCO|nr:uncharacterized protein VICG_01729 [Vittaforma corneae ATCC 50505]ELA41240.1 hypothetical protein VICG_01729 [Vittaforma corneae ATCC 50505]